MLPEGSQKANLGTPCLQQDLEEIECIQAWGKYNKTKHEISGDAKKRTDFQSPASSTFSVQLSYDM